MLGSTYRNSQFVIHYIMYEGSSKHPISPTSTDSVCSAKRTKLDIQNAFAGPERPAIIHPTKRADCWKKFGYPVFQNDQLTDFVVCKDCFTVYSYDSKQGNKTMINHVCKSTLKCADTKKQSILQFNKKKQLSTAACKKINESVVKFAAQDMRPIFMVRGEGFLQFAQTLVDIAAVHGRFDVHSVIAHRTTLITTHLNEIYVRQMDEVTTLMDKCDAISHTLDIWIEKYSNKSYASLSCLFVTPDFNYKKVLYSTKAFYYASKTKANMEKWYSENIPLPNKYHYVTTDNCSNNNCLPDRISCSAHCLNLIVQDMVEKNEAYEVHELIKHAKSLVQWAKRTTLNAKLSTTLKQCCPVRWNSCLTMLESIKKVWDELARELAASGHLQHLEPINKDLLDEAIELLNIFREATNDLETDCRPTLHRVLYWIWKTTRHLQPSTKSDAIEKVKVIGLESLKKKWVDRLDPLHFSAILLDPRAKNSGCISQEQREIGLVAIRRHLCDFEMNINTGEPEAVIVRDTSLTPEEDDFYGSSAAQPPMTPTELQKYLNQPLAPRDTHPLDWWKENNSTFPVLSRVARVLLSIPASSATSERAFSAAGYIINKRRVRLHHENVDKLLFIRSAAGLNPFCYNDNELSM